jgi:hypothetical protein
MRAQQETLMSMMTNVSRRRSLAPDSAFDGLEMGAELTLGESMRGRSSVEPSSARKTLSDGDPSAGLSDLIKRQPWAKRGRDVETIGRSAGEGARGATIAEGGGFDRERGPRSGVARLSLGVSARDWNERY